MADFVAVLRKTVDALGENTPEMREKVFEKARGTIEAKLKAIQPPPPQMVVDRQRKALEDAIAIIKADYAKKAAPEKDETLEDIFASLKSLSEAKPEPRPTAPVPAAAPVATPSPSASSTPVVAPPPRPAERKPYEPYVSSAAKSGAPQSGAVSAPSDPAVEIDTPKPGSPKPGSMPKAMDPVLGVDDEVQGPPTEEGVQPVAIEPVRQRRRVSGGLIAAVVALLVIIAGGYGVWVNRDDFAALAGLGQTPAEEEPVTTAGELTPPAAEPAAEPVEAAETAEPAPAAEAAEPAEEEELAAAPASEDGTAEPEPAGEESAKFTQRLMPDGSEVDEGPAGGPRSIGEGTSVASATQPDAGETATDASPESDAAAPAAGEATAPPQAAAEQAPPPPATVAVGQKAIFYEERTTSASGSAEVGNIVWSVVEESPGGDLPPEPAIRAEAVIPGKDMQLRMTIRRNGDQTLPASHIIEMIFLTPDGFEGGGIANVSRVSFKETEQAAGNALIGIPAKIADGFFLIALGDAPAEVETNTTLLRRQSWIDIPITYQSGRRALLSMEKGIPGDKVFQDTLRAWAEASSG
jgi:hypothetical protein